MKWKQGRRKRSWPNLRYNGTYLELRKPIKFIQEADSQAKTWSRGLPKTKHECYPLDRNIRCQDLVNTRDSTKVGEFRDSLNDYLMVTESSVPQRYLSYKHAMADAWCTSRRDDSRLRFFVQLLTLTKVGKPRNENENKSEVRINKKV
jgi:hypothetical protein